ncbi:MAG: hypothetical protein ABEK50_06295 [bacterium]
MTDDDNLKELIQNALQSDSLRLRFSQDRSSDELVESAARKGYSISRKDAQKILAGAFLTSEEVSEDLKNQLVGGLSWDYLNKFEAAMDGDLSMLEEKRTWERVLDFYEYVFNEEED